MADDDGTDDHPRIDLSGDREPNSTNAAGNGPGEEPTDEPGSTPPGNDPRRPEPRSTPIEPGSPSVENAAFVLLGALLTVLLLVRLFVVVLG